MTLKRSAIVVLTAAALAAPAGAQSLKPKATVTIDGKTQTFNGGRCIPVLDGFRLQIGAFTAPRYFSLQYLNSMSNGTHKGAVVGVHFASKYYTSKANATITLKNKGK